MSDFATGPSEATRQRAHDFCFKMSDISGTTPQTSIGMVLMLFQEIYLQQTARDLSTKILHKIALLEEVLRLKAEHSPAARAGLN